MAALTDAAAGFAGLAGFAAAVAPGEGLSRGTDSPRFKASVRLPSIARGAKQQRDLSTARSWLALKNHEFSWNQRAARVEVRCGLSSWVVVGHRGVCAGCGFGVASSALCLLHAHCTR